MAAIHIRDVPGEVVEALKRRAKRNHRSLQKELLHVLASVAREGPRTEPLPPIDLKFSQAGGSSDWRREELYGDDGR